MRRASCDCQTCAGWVLQSCNRDTCWQLLGSEEAKTGSCGHVQHSRWLGIVPVDEILVTPTDDQLQGHNLASASSGRGLRARPGRVPLTKQAAECTPLSCFRVQQQDVQPKQSGSPLLKGLLFCFSPCNARTAVGSCCACSAALGLTLPQGVQ